MKIFLKSSNSKLGLLKAGILLAFVLVFSFSCKKSGRYHLSETADFHDTIKRKQLKRPALTFGIPSDSFRIITNRIKPNRFLSDILWEYGVSRHETDEVIRNSSKVFNARDIRAGHTYTILSDRDSAAKVRYVIYEHDPSTFYIFSFNDSLNITLYKEQTRSSIKFSSVTIETSLWDAMITRGINPELASDLSDIFAWTVDFFGLQKGDCFKVIYEERFLSDKSTGIGKIYGAEFDHLGSRIFAIPVIQSDKESYYDAAGNSLRKAFLKAPLRFSRITSGFSSGRMHPILRIVRPHYGVDYAAAVGTPVYSIGDGKIISTEIGDESGKIVRIRHNSVYSTAYMHLSNFGKGIVPGAAVKQGEIIGYVGNSGLSTGPHLDFRIYMNGYAVNPLRIDAPPVEPVLEENKAKFEKIRSVIQELLATIN
jgi:murein DD-endopeptidase MepM/ murein hydrolase activator NlpD